MRMGLFGHLFDSNKDGKLDYNEEVRRQLWFEHEKKLRDKRNKESQKSESTSKYIGGCYPVNTWEDEYRNNIFGVDPNFYLDKSEFLRDLEKAREAQRRWIAALSPEEKSLAKKYQIVPSRYATYQEFRRRLDKVVKSEVSKLTVDDEAEKVSPSLLQDTENMRKELQRKMKISVSKKKAFLQETFELLKEDYTSNGSAIKDIIGKMAKLDCDCAVGMWKYLIQAYPDVLHGFYDFGYSIMNTLERAIDSETVYRLVVEDSFLKNAIFSELGDMQYSPIQAIRFYVFSGQTEIADELLALSYHNKYRRTSFFEILDGILNNYYDERLGDDAFEMLMGWIEKVDGKQDRAKLNLAMLNYMEEE